MPPMSYPRRHMPLLRPESIERILKEAEDYAGLHAKSDHRSLQMSRATLRDAIGRGDVADVLKEWVNNHSADLVVVGTSSRAGLGKVVLGSIAEEIIREAPCPVLTVGPHVTQTPQPEFTALFAPRISHPVSLRAEEIAVSLAHEYQAHLTLGTRRRRSPQRFAASRNAANREALTRNDPSRTRTLYEPEVMVETGQWQNGFWLLRPNCSPTSSSWVSGERGLSRKQQVILARLHTEL